MYPTSSILFLTTLITLPSHAFSIPSPSSQFNDSASSIIVQQNLALAPPIPILEIGYQHIIGQIGENMTIAGNRSFSNDQQHPGISRFTSLREKVTPAECGPQKACVDGSCCNSEGKCGFTPYNCNNTASTTCISNCDAHAQCGVDSLDGAQKCPLNICCSYFGYCGTTDLFCTGVPSPPSAAKPSVSLPCQPGFGSCQVPAQPTCDRRKHTASKGRKVAYWQSGNVQRRGCDKVWPCQIDTTALTHLIFAFLFIDPKTFQVTPVDSRVDIPLYREFTGLKNHKLQTWIAVGGSGLNDPNTPTYTTFSDMASTPENRAAFITSIIAFMEQYGFQGVDLDWETPTLAYRGGRPVDFVNIVQLTKEMRAAFGTKYGISIAVPTDFYGLSTFDLIAMQPYLEFFNFMAYDIHGPWEATSLGSKALPQASILDIQDRIVPLWFDGIDPSKVNLGLPYYGRGYALSDTSCTDPGCPYSGPTNAGACTNSPGILSLKEIQDLIKQKNLVPILIPDQMQKEVTFDGNQWIAYDDAETMAMKEIWANEHCLGGTVAWSMDFIAGNGNPGPASAPAAPPALPFNPNLPVTASVDGSCGGQLSCLGTSFGQCCSSHGFCGSTSAYCSISGGCQTNFGLCGDNVPLVPIPSSTSTPLPSATRVSVDGSCGRDTTCQNSPFGNCCSSHGYCGSTDDYCSTTSGCQVAFGSCNGVVSPHIPAPLPPAPLKTSIDGSCGNDVTCSNSVFGNCCSKNNYCGSSSDYCAMENGCQTAFGGCGVQPPPLTISIDGSCGNGVTCVGSVFGNCCSKNNYCGASGDYCDSANCQSAFGTCSTAAIAVPPPAPTPEVKISVDGSCGEKVTCKGSVYGDVSTLPRLVPSKLLS
ncbi:(Trans)glycosidase [Glarea lozoyensis ATCC 20868]|uniref:chitinase n=1 Tax=Glarea lozoyensis (strain ATCC 20868 / MF5171) TaxID=1116229 RepID=S3CUP2_GLAL2|nr:(Trans)glycosidase [Glarea lozoyensis ATCC 20868]EPE30127.1 (Trans)glycosidase [Glarea lozoyensis ATCC 20868]